MQEQPAPQNDKEKMLQIHIPNVLSRRKNPDKHRHRSTLATKKIDIESRSLDVRSAQMQRRSIIERMHSIAILLKTHVGLLQKRSELTQYQKGLSVLFLTRSRINRARPIVPFRTNQGPVVADPQTIGSIENRCDEAQVKVVPKSQLPQRAKID